MRDTFVCEICGETYFSTDRSYFEDRELCSYCLEHRTLICARCGERIWSNENQGTCDIPLCQSCYDNHYTTCENCGALLTQNEVCYLNSEDDEEPLCYSCYSRRCQSRGIHGYYFKPEPIFYGTGPRFFGVELEIDGAGEDHTNAARLTKIANAQTEHLYCKHDGSLDEGFELVTHPMSLAYHQKDMPWSTILQEAADMGYASHQAGTCGLHIHIGRTAFGTTVTEQDAAIARILYFFEKHWEELLKFSRRSKRQLERWAARYGYKEHPKDILDHAKKGYGSGRYSCINLQNRETIEFRIFRGTLKYNSLIATLQLVDRVCDVALFMSDDEVKNLSWTTFVSGCTQPELVQYLKERRLYINDPIESTEEV